MLLSPHVYDIRERIQIDGQFVTEKHFVSLLHEVIKTTHHLSPSYFEVLTLMGYLGLSKNHLDYAVIETGFGGRLDATNVITNSSKVCVLGQIGLDHTEVLGSTIEKIAVEKAGIVQPGNTVVALKQASGVNAVFEQRCEDQHAQLVWVEPGVDYQSSNDQMALTVCKLLAQRDNWQFEESIAQQALQSIYIPGRFEKRTYKNHLAILDGAHNPQKLSALTQRLHKDQLTPVTFVLSIGDRKDIDSCIEQLANSAKRIIATEFFTSEQDIPKRPVPAEQLARTATARDIEANALPSPLAALNQAAQFEEPIVITGSFYLLGEVDKFFTN